MPKDVNVQKVNNLKEKLTKAKSVVFAKYHGLDANKVNELRAKVIESGAEMTVAKNTLTKIALKDAKLHADKLESDLKGPIATFFSYEDAIAPIKVLAEFAKGIELPEMVAGIIDGKYVNVDEIKILSELPSKQELLARVVGGLNSPISGFVNVLSGNKKKLVYALNAVAEKKASEEVSN